MAPSPRCLLILWVAPRSLARDASWPSQSGEWWSDTRALCGGSLMERRVARKTYILTTNATVYEAMRSMTLIGEGEEEELRFRERFSHQRHTARRCKLPTATHRTRLSCGTVIAGKPETSRTTSETQNSLNAKATFSMVYRFLLPVSQRSSQDYQESLYCGVLCLVVLRGVRCSCVAERIAQRSRKGTMARPRQGRIALEILRMRSLERSRTMPTPSQHCHVQHHSLPRIWMLVAAVSQHLVDIQGT